MGIIYFPNRNSAKVGKKTHLPFKGMIKWAIATPPSCRTCRTGNPAFSEVRNLFSPICQGYVASRQAEQPFGISPVYIEPYAGGYDLVNPPL